MSIIQKQQFKTIELKFEIYNNGNIQKKIIFYMTSSLHTHTSNYVDVHHHQLWKYYEEK